MREKDRKRKKKQRWGCKSNSNGVPYQGCHICNCQNDIQIIKNHVSTEMISKVAKYICGIGVPYLVTFEREAGDAK